MSKHRVSIALPVMVYGAELRAIRERREAAARESSEGEEAAVRQRPLPEIADNAPTTKNGLIGLAISGGGIRSSTFSLGVIQSLARAGYFKLFDYISTVSGGGYTGSMLSSLLRDAGDTADALVKRDGEEESTALQHLRNGSNYLSPGGLDDTVRLPAVVLRGLLLNTLQVLPFMMIAVFFTEIVHESRFKLLGLVGTVPGLTREVFEWIPLAIEPFVLMVLATLLFYRVLVLASRGTWENRDRQEKYLGRTLLLGGVLLVAIPLMSATGWAIQQPYSAVAAFVRSNFSLHVWAIVFGLSLGAFTLVRASKTLSTVLGRSLFYGAAVLGPAVVFALYLLLVIAQVDSPFVQGTFEELTRPAAGDSDSAVAIVASVPVSADLRRELAAKGIQYAGSRSAVAAGDSIADVPGLWCPTTEYGTGEGAWQLPDSSGKAAPAPKTCALTDSEVEELSSDGGAGAVEPFYRIARRPGSYEVFGADLHLWGPSSSSALMSDSLFLVLALSLLAFNYLFLNVNMSSLHGFYRDRLSKLYLFRVDASGRIDPNDEQKLSDLSRPGSRAPYHIINTTLNMQGDVVESARGRSSDFFFFSKLYCGGPHTDYCETKALERLDPHLDLGAAMAISAAAAAPNMGSTTKKSLVFILTLLNLRLGYWLPNPRFVNKQESAPLIPWKYRPGVARLFDEALGKLNADAPMVNVSDGGHLENLAIYELLRRRCAVIVAIDGEADPALTFHGLVTLIRLARIDLGITITIDLDECRWTSDRVTKRHCVPGTIDYGSGETGKLLYVKSTVTGDEPPYITRYREDHGSFPHETTADQFFSEIQFEAYRALGAHVGNEVGKAFVECLGGSDVGGRTDARGG